jgi:uncharacterized repeat protein (TIGR01451 family)
MAAPHVAGLAALLLSANPALHGKVDTLEQVIKASAVPLAGSQACGGIPAGQVPNAVYGWGRIDAAAGYNNLRIAVSLGASSSFIDPGGKLTYTFSVRNLNKSELATNVVLTDALPAGVEFLAATPPYILLEDVMRWDFERIDPGGEVQVELLVRVSEGSQGLVINDRYAVTSDQAPVPVSGPPVVIRVGSSFLMFPLVYKQGQAER